MNLGSLLHAKAVESREALQLPEQLNRAKETDFKLPGK
jgi:hypothetical protein